MKLQKEISTNQLREATLRKHYMFLLKRDIVSKDTVKNFAKALESLKYCQKSSAIALMFFCNTAFTQSQIVIGSGNLGNGSFVIGGNIIDADLLYENKFTKGTPIPTPKPKPKKRGKYKKSEAQKLKEALKKLNQ
jgi:hypothetical protein